MNDCRSATLCGPLCSYSFRFFYLIHKGFLSLDCGGPVNFTDALGLSWTSDVNFIYGEVANISVANETRKQYTTVRHFPADSRKYCYRLDVTSRARYLLRATFLYGYFDSNNVYPKFDISVGPTHWSTIAIYDANTIESIELIFLASSSSISVCLSNATTGKPFISTLELRQFNGSVYLTAFENQFYLSVSARINFGADSVDPVRVIYQFFLHANLLTCVHMRARTQPSNYLVDVAAGTKKVSTDMPINVNYDLRPPEKVMQTAVVGMKGSLSYRLNLDGFPGFGWAYAYFAEIEDLDPTGPRKFVLVLPEYPDISNAEVNIKENAHGKYRLYEAGYNNLSLPFVLKFGFKKTSDSSRGPLLNAMEIHKYLEKNDGSLDGDVISGVILLYSTADWAQEGGDPCLPVPWSWVQCNSDARPQIIKLSLSSKNLSGTVPSGLTKLTGLVELWLDGNSLTGPIPDFTGCTALEIIYVQNNMLSGTIPSGINRKVTLNYSGNINLHEGARRGRHMGIIIGLSVGAAVLLITTIVSYLLMQKGKKRHPEQEQLRDSLPVQTVVSTLSDAPGEAAHCFTSFEIEDATKNFEKKIGSGGFGVVYYGKMKDGREIAVKVLTSNSYQGKREFSNEMRIRELVKHATVELLNPLITVPIGSRIHHRNLVQFLGFCQEVGKSMLVYEFMHNGTLKEHLYGPLKQGRSINWIRRLEIAEDAAKGIEYLHTGCVPAVIHRDLKTSNILLDKNMRAKVADSCSRWSFTCLQRGSRHCRVFGSGVRYYISQQLTDKSDVYSFGVVLLELMSGQEAISNDKLSQYSTMGKLVDCPRTRGLEFSPFVFGNFIIDDHYAKLHIERGDIQRIIDPSLCGEYDIQSMWKVAEKALMCVQPHGHMRPSMSELLKDIRDAILIEREVTPAREAVSDEMYRNSGHSSANLGGTENYRALQESTSRPAAR
uniref:Protein kinase domain-containing protein n=1 Tax=Salix viminalis TaxID=40686 RepID=A0A6N2NAY8_SALVM